MGKKHGLLLPELSKVNFFVAACFSTTKYVFASACARARAHTHTKSKMDYGNTRTGPNILQGGKASPCCWGHSLSAEITVPEM